MKIFAKEKTGVLRMFSSIILAVMLVIFFSESVRSDSSTLSLTFGTYESEKSAVVQKQFAPILEYMQSQMKKKLNRPVDIKLKIYNTYEEGNDAIVKGEVDFVRFGPASYIIAKERNPKVKLIVMEHKDGKKLSKGIIAASAQSSVKSLADLNGRRFAFGDNTSTIGRYLSQAELAKAGIRAKDLASFDYLERHDMVFKAVETGVYDAGALKQSTFNKLNKDGQLRIIHSFDNITKPWIARNGLEPKVFDAIKESLLNLKDPAVLKELKEATGFLPATDEDYKFVREGMQLSRKFEGDKK
jgi:phosphonate transport system substrate-binding protein